MPIEAKRLPISATAELLLYNETLLQTSRPANCTVLCAVVLTQYRRVADRRTDGQTDGIDIASTALAMRALRRAVKTVS